MKKRSDIDLKDIFAASLVLLFGVIFLIFVIQDVARLSDISIWYDFKNGIVIGLSITAGIFIVITAIFNVMIYDWARTSRLNQKIKILEDELSELKKS